jgi:PAS domain S-box-containing protein
MRQRMRKEYMTKEQLIKESDKLRQRIAELEKAEDKRKRVEEALKRASAYNRSLIEASLDPLLTIGPDGKITDVNRAAEEVTGCSREELIGSDFSDYFTDPESARAGYREFLERGSDWDYPLDLKHRNGHLTAVLYNASVYRDESGKVIGAFAAARDISKRKGAEERLLSQTAIINSVNRVLREAIMCESEEQLAKACLALAEESTGAKFGFIDELNAAGKVDTIAISDPGWEACRMPKTNAVVMLKNLEVRGIWASVIRQGRSLIVNDPASHPDRVGTPPGHPQITSFLGVPLKQAGRTIGLIGLANKEAGYSHADREAVEALSAAFAEALIRKRAEEELKRTLVDLQRSNAELEQFAYVASHDLQEPLRTVASFVQLLARRYKGELDSDADEFIAYATDGANRMQRLINDLLVYSRVSTRGKEFELADCTHALGQAIANLQKVILENGAVVTNDDMPRVKADETQLIQLFQNLIDNAIKFHSEEPPRIHVAARKEGKEWLFSVQDNGIGIDPQYNERIFVIFQRLHEKDKYPGTGIGLAICKRIVERHRGRIWVESTPEKGSTFLFTIPEKGGE